MPENGEVYIYALRQQQIQHIHSIEEGVTLFIFCCMYIIKEVNASQM